MKKTLVDLTYFSFPDGNPNNIIHKCSSTIGFLEKLGARFTTHFVVRSNSEFSVIDRGSVKVHFFKGTTVMKWQIPFWFHNYIKSLKPDYILVHGFGTAHYLMFLKIICPKAKIMLQCNGFAPSPKGLKKLIFTISDSFIDGYLFTGIGNARPWIESNSISKNKIIEIMEGSVVFRFKGNQERKRNSFIWVGRLDNNKDPLTIIKAFNRFLAIEPKAKLTMVFHEGELASQVADYISVNSLTASIALKGFVVHADLELLFHHNQYFILGSHYEGSGYALLEAMACGCVPVVTDIPSFRFMTDNGNCGLLFPPSNEEELLVQLRKTTAIDYDHYQIKVLANFEDKLSFQAIADTLATTFQSL